MTKRRRRAEAPHMLGAGSVVVALAALAMTSSARPIGASPPAALQARTVHASLARTCAVTGAGDVSCWGSNSNGRLGDGTTLTRVVPVGVRDLRGVLTIGSGADHTCALTSLDGVKCWGRNSSGELGDGTKTDRKTPVSVAGLSGRAVAVAVGFHHTCALLDSRTVECWGANSRGQVGNGSNVDSPTPVAVARLTSIAAVAAGGSHTCALTSAGGVKCWGSNTYGQLGVGSIGGSSLTPMDVADLTGVASIAAGGEHNCAVTTEGAAKCWGIDNHGQLGTIDRCGTFPDWACSTPGPVDGLSSGISAIAAGLDHTCARTNAGALKCWGEGDRGQLGNGAGYSYVPVDVVGFQSGAAEVTVGATHTCALTVAGDVRCWGDNSSGQVGDSTRKTRSTPVAVLAGPEACVAPRLSGKTLAAVTSALAKTACDLGPIRRAYSAKVKKGHVVSQRPAPGTRLPAGTPVMLVLSKGRPGR